MSFYSTVTLKSVFFLVFAINISISLADTPNRLGWSDYVHENTRLYDIELIVFKIAHDKYSTFESWNDDISTLLDANSIALFDYANQSALNSSQLLHNTNELQNITHKTLTNPVITLLNRDELLLQEEAKKIQRYHETKVLLYTGWRQAFNDGQKTRLHLFGGKNFVSEYDVSGFRRQQTLTSTETIQVHPWDINNVYDELKEPTVLQLWELDGFLDINLSKYMHFNANFVLREPTTFSIPLSIATPEMIEQSNQSQSLSVSAEIASSPQAPIYTFEKIVEYKLTQSRKLKSHDLHYIDHPKLGILLQIRPSAESQEKLDQLMQSR